MRFTSWFDHANDLSQIIGVRNSRGKEYIQELVVGGAKSYSYETANGCTKTKGKTVIPQAGITLNRDNDDVILF